MTKLISTRRQITTGKPRTQQTFAPPTNLTTADILDLPIIFADNDSTLLQPSIEEPQPILVTQRKQTPSKYVVINKQTLVPTTSAPLQTTPLKRPSSAIRQPGQKFARIIINPSQLQEVDDSKRQVLITNQKVKNDDFITISPKKMDPTLEFVDLETELKTNTVPKPMHTTVVSAQTIKNKPDIKNLASASRNVTMRVPVQVSRALKTSETNPGTENIYLINNAKKRSIKTNQDLLKTKSYRLDFEDENMDGIEMDK